MKPYSRYLLLTLCVLLLITALSLFWLAKHRPINQPGVDETSPPTTTTVTSPPSAVVSATPTSAPTVAPTPTPTDTPRTNGLVFPIADFHARITKKRFGQYITPQTSPVQPERFTGYHTGVDVEYGDLTADVPVYAVSDGTVVRSGWVSGYGGLLVIRGTVNGQTLYFLYGHVRQSSLPASGKVVKQGEQVGALGTAYSHETDGERRHLHFAVYAGATLDIRGYVQNQSELTSWRDPLSLF